MVHRFFESAAWPTRDRFRLRKANASGSSACRTAEKVCTIVLAPDPARIGFEMPGNGGGGSSSRRDGVKTMTRRLIGPTGMQRRGWLHLPAALVVAVLLMVSLGAATEALADTVTEPMCGAGTNHGHLGPCNDPAGVIVLVESPSATEGTDATLDFEVTLSKPHPSRIVAMDWWLTPGTATAGEDFTYTDAGGFTYTRPSGTLIFAVGETTKTISVALLDDAVREGTETLYLTLANLVGAEFNHGELHPTERQRRLLMDVTGTILPDEDAEPEDTGPVVVNAETTIATEGTDATIDFEVTLSKPHPSHSVRMEWSLEAWEATAGEDYTDASGTLTFAVGETTKTISVALLDDAVSEGVETLFLRLANLVVLSWPNPVGVDATFDPGEVEMGIRESRSKRVLGMILPDEDTDTPTVTVTNPYPVTVTPPVAQPFDVLVEFSERVSGLRMSEVEVTNGVAAQVQKHTRTEWSSKWNVTIVPDDGLIGNVTVRVPAGVATDSLGNTNAASEPFVIAARTINPDSHTRPNAWLRCDSPSDPAEWAAPGRKKSSHVRYGLSMVNPPRGIESQWGSGMYIMSGLITLTNEDGVRAGGGLGVCTGYGNGFGTACWKSHDIEDGMTGQLTLQILEGAAAIGGGNAPWNGLLRSLASDPMLVSGLDWAVSVADANATEGTDATIDFELRLNAQDDCKAVKVDWATADGTATAGEDYTASSGTLTFEPGETVKTISIPVLHDATHEDDETMTLRLSNALGVEITDAEATGTILNNDTAPLTARFENLPESHDGSSAFTFELHFSEEIPDLSYETVADGLFEVTGANVTKASRTTKGSNRGWLVTAAPSGSGSADIAISLPVRACGETAAVCTADDRALSAAVSATVPREVVTASQTSGEELRLVGGATANEGRLEILLDGQWGTVCDDYWGKADADVACRALGYAEGSVADATQFTGAHFGAGAQSMPIWLDNVQCSGTETGLLACPRRYSPAVGTHNCRHREDVGVRCAGERSAPATVDTPAVPFTAEFRNVPAEHDGSSAFELELAFSEEPNDLSYKTVRDTLFEVSGGRIEGARRVTQGSDLGFYVTVKPSGLGTVTLALATLPACGQTGSVCTGNNRALEGPVGATVHGPVTLSVADVEVDEAEGATLDFVVTMSRSRTAATTVDYATSNDTATAGSDYEAASGTLSFAAGETEKTVSVAVLDDVLDEGSETMTFTLSNPSPSTVKLADAEATGTIRNTDAMPRAWLSRFGRTVAEQVMGAVESRFEAPRAAGVEVSVAGERIGGAMPGDGREGLGDRDAAARLAAVSDWIRGEDGEEDGAGFRTRGVSERELLTGSSFALTGGSEAGGFGALYGHVASSAFDGREGELRVDGEVTSAMLGADFTRGRGTAGLLVSHSEGEGGWRSPVGSGEVESSLTGVYPYGRWQASERLSLWGTVGYGSGSLTLRPDGRPAIEADMDLAMAGAGMRNELLTAEQGEGSSLALTTDGFAVRTASEAVPGELAASEAEVTRLRVGLEGSLELEVGAGRLVPSLEVGVRHDGGDAETGFGADIGAGLSWSDPESGIEAELRARGLLTHEDASLRERGIAGSLAWDPDRSSDRGFSFELRQTVGGASSGGMNALLSRRTLEGLAANDDGDDLELRRLEATLGYGIGMFGDRFTGTPEVGVGLSNADREYRVGWRLGLVRRKDFGFEVRLDASRREPANDDREPSQRIGVRLTARW